MRRKKPNDDVRATWIPQGAQQVMFGGNLFYDAAERVRILSVNDDGTYDAEVWDAASGGWLPVRLDARPSDSTRKSMHFEGER